MDVAALYDAVSEVCPIIGVTVDNPTNRSQWSYVPKASATAPQLAAADNVLATISPTVKSRITTTEFIARWTNAEYLLLLTKRAANVAANKVGNAKNWDIVVSGDYVDCNKKKVQTLKADLVTDSVLTQIRADEIFG